MQRGRGVVEQMQRTVEVSEAADDDGQRHLQPGSELGGVRRVSEVDACTKLPGGRVEMAELALGDADRPLQPGAIGEIRRVELLSPNRLGAYSDRISLDVVTKLRHAHRVERVHGP